MVEEAISQILLANSGVNAVVGDRVRPTEGDGADDVPLVLFEVTDTENLGTHDGAGDTDKVSFTVTVVGETKKETFDLGEKVRNALHYYGGTVAGYTLRPVFFQSKSAVQRGVIEGRELTVYTQDLEFTALVKV